MYSVQDLSFRRALILGGNHNQNSFTFTQDFLAAIKCQNSCTIIRTIKAKIQSIIQTI